MEGSGDSKSEILQTICVGISIERALELLEAASGNVERAVDIHFHQEQEAENDPASTFEELKKPVPPKKRSGDSLQTPTNSKKMNRRSSSKKSTPVPDRTQTRLDSFFVKQPKQHGEPDSEQESYKELSISADERSFPKYKLSSPELKGRDQSIPMKTVVTKNSLSTGNMETSLKAGSKEDVSTSLGINGLNIKRPLFAPLTLTPVPKTSLRLCASLNSATTSTTTTNTTTQSDKKLNTAISSSLNEVPFRCLAESLQEVVNTSKRSVKLNLLKECICHILSQAEDTKKQTRTLTCALLLILGFRGNNHAGNNQAPMEIGGAALYKALQTTLRTSRMQLSKGYRKYGDMGDAAASLFQKNTFYISTTDAKQLTIVQVFDGLESIVKSVGQDLKQQAVLQLLSACNTKTELRFLVRLLIGNMRIGAGLKTVLAAFAMALFSDSEDDDANGMKLAIQSIQKSYDLCPDIGKIVSAVLSGGLEQMRKDCCIQLFTPVSPMLAHPVYSLDQIEKVMKIGHPCVKARLTMEYKYDGIRCQVHVGGKSMKLFSRQMFETTLQYPDAGNACLEAAQLVHRATSFILDAEIVAVEGEGADQRLLPFQHLSQRKRKHDGSGVRIKVYAFDIMYLNGMSLTDKPLHERQKALRTHFRETRDFSFVTSQALPAFSETSIRSFLEEAIAMGGEGLMLKYLGEVLEGSLPKPLVDPQYSPSTILSPYEAGIRSRCWFKVKKDYIAGYSDTIDVVPIGAWFGSGRKAEHSYLSPVLLAVYDEEEDVYRSISRCMSFTDAMYNAMREFYFHGKEYPVNVGIDGTEETKVHSLDCPCIGDDEEDDYSDYEGIEIGDKDSWSEDSETRVNCFSSRPSSAYILTNESPPIWFKPLEVFEVSFADLTLSRQHTAGAGLLDDPDGRGIALRFPRFKRRRPDKKPGQATTSLQVAQLFSQQAKQRSSSLLP